MHMDVLELREFYASRLGDAVVSSVSMALSPLWGDANGEHLLGLGYAVPLVNRFGSDCENSICLMPAGQGALPWPSAHSPATLLSHDDEFPFRDSSFDRLLMVHFLEHAENANECLSEAWRVLTPGGKLIVVVPNRRGVWARFENTPFGTGKPYSRGQLNKVLKLNQFTPEAWSDALHFPPSGTEISMRMRNSIEGFGKRVWPVFAGAICVFATKRLFQGIPVKARARRRLAVPVLVPQGTGRASRDGE
ncbi:MAG: methyltransferase domain-containing protein [Pseudomonadota bacterium]